MGNNWLVVIVVFSCYYLLAIKHDINWKGKESALLYKVCEKPDMESAYSTVLCSCSATQLCSSPLKSLWKAFGHERKAHIQSFWWLK